MNCEAIQSQILALPDPRELTPALRGHVAACTACQTWAAQASRLESLLTRLPVPAAPRGHKAALIESLTAPAPVIRSVPNVPRAEPLFGGARRFVRRNATYLAGLAAAVVIGLGIYWLTTRPGTPQPELVQTQKHPLLEKMVARDIALARAKSPVERLDLLGGMAEELAAETRGMARIAPGDELRQMVGWYDKVVIGGILAQAKEPPLYDEKGTAEWRKMVDALAAKLDRDADEAEKLAREAPADAQPSLKKMTDTARAAAASLRPGATRSPASATPDATEVLTAEDRVRLLKANAPIIETLVDSGVRMTTDPVSRAERCLAAARALATAAGEAAKADDTERVAVLTGLFRDVVRNGILAPIDDMLYEARLIPLDSPAGARLVEIRAFVARDVSALRDGIEASGKLSESPKGKDAIRQLNELSEALKPRTPA